jgi:GxxExxY protein
MKKTARDFGPVTHLVIGCAIEVHKELGPGLLESTYRRCFAHELARRKVPFAIEVPIAIQYKGLRVECAYRIDVFVNRQVIVELKSVEALKWVHEAQVLTHMRLAKVPFGFLINFNVPLLTDGLRSYVLGPPETEI